MNVENKVNRIAEWIAYECDDVKGELKYLLHHMYRCNEETIDEIKERISLIVDDYDAVFKRLSKKESE
tara:strand:+ start:25 stop:228 length:204 start_codon:yes stop_codon:yes gene_type:complete